MSLKLKGLFKSSVVPRMLVVKENRSILIMCTFIFVFLEKTTMYTAGRNPTKLKSLYSDLVTEIYERE